MVIFVLIVLAIVVLVAARMIKNSAARHDYAAQTAQNPLDPELAEVFRRPAASAGWKVTRAAEDALREATRHIHRRTREQGQTPLLIVHSGLGYDPTADNGLLVVTTCETLLFTRDRMQTVSHADGPTTRILTAPGGRDPAVRIEGHGRPINVACPDLEQAQLICTVIDLWAESPGLQADARVRVNPHRVELPDVFFADVLRAAGHAVTPFNMRSIHERIGSLISHKARTMIEASQGLAAGERFADQHGRPLDDRDLPTWAARALEGWIAVDPDIGYTGGPYLPAHFRRFRLDTIPTGGYLANPSQPLSMWMNDWYEDNGRGVRKALAPGQPPVSA